MNDQFHADRLTGLGGSDLGEILGLSPYRTPFEVWQEKTGRSEPFSGNLATRFGTYAEQFIAEEYTRQTGRNVQRFNAMLRHSSAPVIGHVDRLVIPDGAKRASHRTEIRTDTGLECKTAGAYAVGRGSDWGESGTDQVPESYLVQCAAYMALTGCEHWDLAALIGGNADFRIYHLHRDMDLEDMLLTEADRWWQAHVVADTPPDPSSEAEAQQRWARHQPGKVATLDHGAVDRLRNLAAVKAEIKRLQADEQDLRDYLMPLFADADELHDAAGNKLATYRANKDGALVDWQGVATAMMDADKMPKQERENWIVARTTITPGARVLRLANTLTEDEA